MKIIVIKDCNSCGHKGHSGSGTKGGAYPLCFAMKKENARSTSQESPGYKGSVAILPWRDDVFEVAGRQRKRRLYTGEIPDWCPLSDLEDVCKKEGIS